MSDSESEQNVADEQVAEKRYNEWLAEHASRLQRGVNSQIQNTWTTTVRTDAVRSGKLIGRVRVAEGNELFDGDQFYIGTASGETDGVPVYSHWAPLFAEAFYLGGRIDRLGDIHAVRTLDRVSDGRITVYEDQVLSTDPPSPLFPRRKLVIPKPAGREGGISIIESMPAAPPIAPLSVDDEPAQMDPDLPPRVVGAPSNDHGPAGPPSEQLELRAADTLLRKLAAPKRGDMAPVLATLQPDQYRAITRPATDSVIFQGHAGTGKTVIAVHRIAYLTSSEAGQNAANRPVMLIGPTREYAEHVRPAVRELIGDDDGNVLIISLPALLQDLAGVQFDKRTDTRVEDGRLVGKEILEYLQATFNAMKKDGGLDGLDRQEAVRAAYERLRTSPAFPDGNGMDGDWYRFLRALPPFEKVGERSDLRPLLAYFGIRFKKPFSDVAHIIVDESQDVHPFEWEIVGRLGASQGWTILGDMNQRRSELTYRSWKPVASALSIDDEGKAPIVTLERGYRSTVPIMRFAGRLLQRSQRTLQSLQTDGPEPAIVRAAQRDKLAPASVEQATILVERYPEGSVAIIAAATHHIATALRRAGWSAQRDTSQKWSGPAGAVSLLSHDQARGLEFDAVVVVEPADFPTVEGEDRFGSLYTSLTRANKELVVVNHRALPDKLRG